MRCCYKYANGNRWDCSNNCLVIWIDKLHGDRRSLGSKYRTFQKEKLCMCRLGQPHNHIQRISGKESDARTVHVDFSNFFDEVENGLRLYNKTSKRIGGILINFISFFLIELKQGLIVEWHSSNWKLIEKRLQQDRVLGLISFCWCRCGINFDGLLIYKPSRILRVL